MFTIGSNLRGVLWESNAVPELLVQVQNLASTILSVTKERTEENVIFPESYMMRL